MEKVSLKTYAVKHKLSLFDAMKMVKSGKLNTIIEEESGKEITYILVDEEKESELKNSIAHLEKSEDLSIQEELKQLREAVNALKVEVELLKKERR